MFLLTRRTADGRWQTNSMRHYVRMTAESDGVRTWLARVLLDHHAGFMNSLKIDDAVGHDYAHFMTKNNCHC